MKALPEAYLKHMKSLLLDQFEAYRASFEGPPHVGIRVNTSKISVEDFLDICPFKVAPIPWTPDGFYVLEDFRPAKHPYYHAGLYYIQEPSAMAPVPVLDLKEGDVVLDLCAAPGGKSLQIANAIGDTGTLVSNDISASRLRAVVKNIELFGIKNAIVTASSIDQFASQQASFYDAVLVDAPCSGEGMFRKDNKLIDDWQEDSNQTYQDIQMALTQAVCEVVKPGGKLAYSTCTFSPLENEEVIASLLEAQPDLYLVPIDQALFAPGVIVDGHEDMGMTKRLYPFLVPGEGHFVALLQKAGCPQTPEKTGVTSEGPEAFKAFMSEVLTRPLEGAIRVHQDRVFLDPPFVPQLDHTRVLRRGWLLGECTKGRFEPHHAFAMGLKKEQIKAHITWGIQDHEVIRYLKGETLAVDAPDGWCVVCLDDFPLGWGKVVKGRLKNKYPPAWRMQ